MPRKTRAQNPSAKLANAGKCTGPRTPQGKRRSARNALNLVAATSRGRERALGTPAAPTPEEDSRGSDRQACYKYHRCVLVRTAPNAAAGQYDSDLVSRYKLLHTPTPYHSTRATQTPQVIVPAPLLFLTISHKG